MAAVINIMHSSSGIGQIIFDEAPPEFTAARTGGGFRLMMLGAKGVTEDELVSDFKR